ncbi:MAG: hypoxanthine phosphoribosyltransferase [Candidatus Delongbacteria bacterium]|nr:hypoxanthine phosphoribosyltransferase [Candidatus Delongbacteria bacterium]
MQKLLINGKSFSEYISENDLRSIVDKTVSEIVSEMKDIEEPVIIGILNGGVPFMNEIIFRMPENVIIDYVKAVSYGDGTISSGKIELLLDTKLDLKGRTVLLVDDISDTGRTLEHIAAKMKEKGAAAVKTACLFYKKCQGVKEPDFYGAESGDDFIVGFGLDYAQRGRNIKRILKLDK